MSRSTAVAGNVSTMATNERARDRGLRQAARLRADLASELRDARLMAGLSQDHVARAVGVTQSAVSRAERGRHEGNSIEALAVHFAALGMRLSLKAYPVGSPVRDRAHLALLGRLRQLVSDAFGWHPDALVGTTGDQRAWDVLLSGPARIGVDAETRLYDIQAIQRRCQAKARDSGVDHIILLVADTRHNRRVLTEHAADLGAVFPLKARHIRGSLAQGRDPGASGVVWL